MILVDPPTEYPPEMTKKLRHKTWSHMVSDTSEEELLAFAAKLGLKRSWFQCRPKASAAHFDITPPVRERAIALGAVEVSSRELPVMVCVECDRAATADETVCCKAWRYVYKGNGDVGDEECGGRLERRTDPWNIRQRESGNRAVFFTGDMTPLMRLGTLGLGLNDQGRNVVSLLSIDQEILLDAWEYCAERVADFAKRLPQSHRTRKGRRYYQRWFDRIDAEVSRREALTDLRAEAS